QTAGTGSRATTTARSTPRWRRSTASHARRSSSGGTSYGRGTKNSRPRGIVTPLSTKSRCRNTETRRSRSTPVSVRTSSLTSSPSRTFDRRSATPVSGERVMRDLRRRTLLGAGLLTGAGVLSACGATPSSVCLAGEQEVDTGPVHTFPFIGAEPLRRQPQLGLLGLAVSPDGTRVAAHEWWHRKSLSESGTAGTTIWDATTGEIITRFDDT